MSQETRQAELRQKTQALLHGSLKHVRVAALAAALVPLASIAVSNAVVQSQSSGGAVPSPCDFVTSGGFVIGDNGHKANFGAHGGCKKEAFWGHVNFVDHETGFHVNSVEITGYLDPLPGFGEVPGSTIREICGWATTNTDPVPVRFRVRLVDNGEPGDLDEFGIALSNGYAMSTRLLSAEGPGGGNVQLHEPNPSTTAPNPVPDEFTMCGELGVP